jgi:hypothetical protein
LGAEENPPDGMLVRTAGFFGQGFRIFDVWESEERFQRFLSERLMPIVGEVAGADGAQPRDDDLRAARLQQALTVCHTRSNALGDDDRAQR